MKLHISNPYTGQTLVIKEMDHKKLNVFFDEKIGSVVSLKDLGPDFAGQEAKITGGNDKDGFSMLNGVLKKGRVRLLLRVGQNLLRFKRDGQRKRKSVRGCIVGEDISTLNLAVVTQGEKVVAGLADSTTPNRKGPKRASKIRKLFSLGADENVCRLVARRVVKEYENGFKKYKAPKVQRLVTKRVQTRREELKKKRLDRKNQSMKLREEFASVKASQAKVAK